MFELFMTKGIVPQTLLSKQQANKRSMSETKSDAGLEKDENLQRELVKAKHLGYNPSGVQQKSILTTAAESTFNGFSFKPSMTHKQNHLASNFSELTGSTSFIDQKDVNKAKTIMKVNP